MLIIALESHNLTNISDIYQNFHKLNSDIESNQNTEPIYHRLQTLISISELSYINLDVKIKQN